MWSEAEKEGTWLAGIFDYTFCNESGNFGGEKGLTG